MRHIPEEELHAYLDQGLSRSQCVEIESHLAVCPSCQAARDGIAALRDLTTALLAKRAPPRGFPPAFESLRRRATEMSVPSFPSALLTGCGRAVLDRDALIVMLVNLCTKAFFA